MAEQAIRELLAEGLIVLIRDEDGPQGSEIPRSDTEEVLKRVDTWEVAYEGIKVNFTTTSAGEKLVMEGGTTEEASTGRSVRRDGVTVRAHSELRVAARKNGQVEELNPPVLIVDFHFSGQRGECGVVYLRLKGGKPEQLASAVVQVLDLQKVELHEGMKVWLVDRDRDISGPGLAPLAATIRWHEDSGWVAEYLWDEAESL